MLGIASSACGRLSFMTLMYRLFGTTKHRRWLIIFLMTETIVINLFTAITIFTQCPDPRALWDGANFPGKCWSPLFQEYAGFFQGCEHFPDLTEQWWSNQGTYSVQRGNRPHVDHSSCLCFWGPSNEHQNEAWLDIIDVLEHIRICRRACQSHSHQISLRQIWLHLSATSSSILTYKATNDLQSIPFRSLSGSSKLSPLVLGNMS